MIYKNPLKTKKISLKKLSFSSFHNGINTEYDQHLLPINYSINTYNFSFNNGALTEGLGVDMLTITPNEYYMNETKEIFMPAINGALASWVYSFHINGLEKLAQYLVVYCANKKFYFVDLFDSEGDFEEIEGLTLNSVPNAVNYNLNGYDVMIFTSITDGMWVWGFDFLPYQVPNAPKITSMCIHNERLFATVDNERREVWFSDDLDPTNWNISLSEAGFISMPDDRGQVKKIISFKDYVYVFREYGISKISAFGNQTEFSVSHLYFTGSRIYENTICACGEVIFFLTKDGIHVFDGLNVRKINFNIDSIINAGHNATGAYHNGKYYLALNLKFNDGQIIGAESISSTQVQNTSLLEIDVKTGEISILRGIKINSMTSLNGVSYSELVMCMEYGGTKYLAQLTKGGHMFSSPLLKYWQSPFNDLGYPTNDKVIKEVHFKNLEPITLTIISDVETKTFNVSKTNSISKIKTSVKGKIFSFVFSTNLAKAHVSNPQIIYGVL